MKQYVEKELQIINKLGLHARAATLLAQLANKFEAEVTVKLGEKIASASSVLGLMMLQSQQGKTILVSSEGKDAQAALNAVEELVMNKFHEEE